MMRLTVTLIALGVLTGCRGDSRQPSVDPFGPTKVEPPATGSVGMRANGKPQHLGSLQGIAPQPQASASDPGATPSARVSTTGSSNILSGSSTARSTATDQGRSGDCVAIPAVARQFSDVGGTFAGQAPVNAWPEPADDLATATKIPATATSSAVAVASATSSGTAGSRERIHRMIAPQPSSSASSPQGDRPAGDSESASGQPRPLNVPDNAINIMDLPAADSTDNAQSSAHSSGIRLVSGVEQSGTRGPSSERGTLSAGSSPAFSARSLFGHDPNYGWLRGRLEYAQFDRCWKLRYIPIDNETDAFGGSVVLANTSMLSGYERGEFVEVHGRMGHVAPDRSGYAPDFQIHEIERIAN